MTNVLSHIGAGLLGLAVAAILVVTFGGGLNTQANTLNSELTSETTALIADFDAVRPD